MRQNSWTQVVVWRQELCSQELQPDRGSPKEAQGSYNTAFTFSLQWLTAHQSQNSPSAVLNAHLGLSLEEWQCWIWSKMQKSLTTFCTDSILNIAHREVDEDMLHQDLQIFREKKKVSKNLSLPRFFSNVAALSKILLASFGFYIHKTECANPAAYK